MKAKIGIFFTGLFIAINCFTIKCNAQIISAGYNHSLLICPDSTLKVWGDNAYGQLGYTSSDVTSCHCKNYPVEVPGLTGVINAAGGFRHSLAVKSDGTVWAWGWNQYGQLGVGDTIDRKIPCQVIGLTGIIKVACDWGNSLALRNDGTVWAWGSNQYYQLGDGTTVTRSYPVQVTGLSGIIDIACGSANTIVLKSDGTVWGLGANGVGDLGDGTFTDRQTPVQAIGLSGITSIVITAGGVLALKNDSTVWGWGANYYGTIGNNTTINSNIPVQTNIISGITQITSQGAHCFALKNDSTVWAWGRNTSKQLGDSTFSYQENQPKQISGLTNVTSVVASGWAHGLAVKADGSIWSWGVNNLGQLGLGFYYYAYPRKIPTQLSSPCSITAGVDDPEKTGNVNLYPNPATDLLNIDFEKAAFITIMDLNGKIVIQSDKQQIDVSALAKGIYSVVIISGNDRTVKKMVKM